MGLVVGLSVLMVLYPRAEGAGPPSAGGGDQARATIPAAARRHAAPTTTKVTGYPATASSPAAPNGAVALATVIGVARMPPMVP
jgi:hypothetical protein